MPSDQDHTSAAAAPGWYIVGDSHLRAFKHAAQNGLIGWPCQFAAVDGATSVGLRSPHSKTDAIGIFRRKLLPPAPHITPVVHLGEVDCGFVIWYRATKYNEPVDAQMRQSIDATLGFIDALLAAGHRRVVVSGATLPTIPDGQKFGEVADARQEITATLVQRTQLTLVYNAALRAGAAARGQPYIDIAAAVLDPMTGVIAKRFRHPNKRDHHLDPRKAGPLWAAELNRVAAQCGC